MIATSGPQGTPEVVGASSSKSVGGEEMGMHSLMPYEGRTEQPKRSRMALARVGGRPPAALQTMRKCSFFNTFAMC
jgi:hypothetical protein